MKKIFTIFLLALFCSAQAQHHLYLGLRAGAGYGNEMSKMTGLVFGSDYSPSLQIMQTHTSTTIVNAACAGTKFEILYGYKHFRIGYQFDFLMMRTINSTTHLTPPETGSSSEYFHGKSHSTNNFIGNSLLFELLVFQKKSFSISPNISIGYFNRADKNSGFAQNYFQSGVGLMFGFEVKNITLYINPDYSVRYSKDKHFSGSTLRNPYRLYNSALLNFGIRGDILSLKKKQK